MIGRLAWKKTRRPPAEETTKSMRGQWKITAMMGHVLMVYVFCLIPGFIAGQLLTSDSGNIIYVRAYYVCTVIFMISAWINPILYGMKDSLYQRAYCKILPKCFIGVISKRVEDSGSTMH